MNVKTILMAMAETLPENATIHDAINQLEFAAEILDEAQYRAPAEKPAPAWLYESSSRFLAVRNQCLRRH